jgi:hypothetical protein
LGDRPVAVDLGGHPSNRVQHAVAALEALRGRLGELLRRGLAAPGRHHHAALVPDRDEPFPVAAVAVEAPVVDQLADRKPVEHAVVAHLALLRIPSAAVSANF